MARVRYESGIKCKQCGEICTSFAKNLYRVLCQNCGTHILNYDVENNQAAVTSNADIVTVKVTHKLFRDVYEEV